MGNEACSGEVVKKENLSFISEVVDANNGISPIANDRPGSSIVPVVPDSNRGNGELQDIPSPLTVVSSPLIGASTQGDRPTSPYGKSSSTPKGTLFDSFARDSVTSMLAPHHRKYSRESRVHVVRRLNFCLLRDTITSHMSMSDEDHLFETVYGTILDAIFSEQANEPDVGSGIGGCSTPESTPLTWVSKTCPGAPIKCTRKYRTLKKEICKKLEFKL